MTAAEATTSCELRCPSCGNDSSRGVVRYLVDVPSWADALRVRAGVLEVRGPLAPVMGAKSSRPRLECHALRPAPDNRYCGHQWELPESIRGIAWRVRS
jgi:hypothetical protein